MAADSGPEVLRAEIGIEAIAVVEAIVAETAVVVPREARARRAKSLNRRVDHRFLWSARLRSSHNLAA
jgi:hypothetical protein